MTQPVSLPDDLSLLGAVEEEEDSLPPEGTLRDAISITKMTLKVSWPRLDEGIAQGELAKAG